RLDALRRWPPGAADHPAESAGGDPAPDRAGAADAARGVDRRAAAACESEFGGDVGVGISGGFRFSVFGFRFSVFSFQFSVFSFPFSVFSFQGCRSSQGELGLRLLKTEN